MTERRRVNRNNRQRGAAHEKRVAGLLGGVVWPGKDGDVDAHGYRVEAKSVAGMTGLTKLARFIEQAQANGAAAGKPWAVALTGGKTYQQGATFIVLPLEEWDRLCRGEAERRLLEPLRQEHGSWRAIQTSVFALAHAMAEELVRDGGNEHRG